MMQGTGTSKSGVRRVRRPIVDPSHRVAGPPANAMTRLEDHAREYDYSSRRFWGKVKGGNILGIERIDGTYVFHCEPGEMRGPIPDVRQEYLLPPDVEGVSPVVWEQSQISSVVYVLGMNMATADNTPRQHPSVTLCAERGYSGTVICLECTY